MDPDSFKSTVLEKNNKKNCLKCEKYLKNIYPKLTFQAVVIDFFQNGTFQRVRSFGVVLSAPKRFTGAIICPGKIILAFHFLMGGSIFKPLYTHI